MNPPLLLVDDDRDDVELALLGLRRHGLEREVLTARDGVEALELLLEAYSRSRSLPAAVITDLKMPRMDGFELLRRLKADPRLRDIPALVLSSSAHEVDISEATRLGARCYLRKPADLREYAEIHRRIAEVLDAGS